MRVPNRFLAGWLLAVGVLLACMLVLGNPNASRELAGYRSYPDAYELPALVSSSSLGAVVPSPPRADAAPPHAANRNRGLLQSLALAVLPLAVFAAIAPSADTMRLIQDAFPGLGGR